MPDDRPMVHIRLPKTLLKRIDHAKVDLEIDRARAIERILEMGLESMERQAVSS